MEPVNIKMIPENPDNEIIERITSSPIETITSVPHGVYNYNITSEKYEDVSGSLNVDGEKNVAVRLTQKVEPEIYVLLSDYGAVYNNENVDNKPMFRNAMNDLLERGGGTIYVDGIGDLYISENLYVNSGINIIGTEVEFINELPVPKATLKLMPRVENYWCMIHLDNKENIIIRGIGIDSNRDKREERGKLGDLTILPQIAISTGESTRNITVEKCYIHGNGVWLFSSFGTRIHPKDLYIRNNHFKWTMGFATPDKPFYEGVTIDNTLVYFDTIGYEFTNNYIETDTGYANMTGVEAHGANGLVKNNVVRGVRTGIIPWNMVYQEMNIPNNIIIEDNKFIDVLNGMDIGLSPTRNYIDLQIRRNEVTLKPTDFPGTTFSRGIIIGVWNAVNGETSENFVIEDNVIRSRDYEINHKDREIYYNFYGIGVGSGVYKNLNIRNNTIEDMPSFGILVQNEAQKSIKVESGLIEGNIIKNVAKSQMGRGSLDITAIRVSESTDTNTSGLTVGVNEIIDTRSTTETWYTKPTSMPTADRFKEQSITESKLPPQGVIVYDSRNYLIDFTRSVANRYVDSLEVVVTPNNHYLLETNFPGDLWVSADKNIPLQSRVINKQSESIMVDSGGMFIISTRPPKDPDGTSYPYNSSQFENKTYYFTIKRIGDEVPLEGLVISGIGDSIMYGRSDTSGDRISNPWIAQVGQLLDAGQTNNLGISRSTQTRGSDPTHYGTDAQRNPMVLRYEQIPLNSDIIIIQGGVNDLVSNIPLGAMSDRTEGTYYGGLHILYGGIKSRYPNARIIVINMFQSSNVVYHPSGVSKTNWANAQVQVALHYNLEVFDVFNNSALTPDRLDMADGIHFSQNDADKFAQELYEFINGVDNSVEVYNSKNGIDFNQVTAMGYMRTATITLEANHTYKVLTNLPKEHNTGTLSISNDLAKPTQIILSPGVESTITLGASGQLFISGRPIRDPDKADWVYNINKIINGEYEISVMEG